MRIETQAAAAQSNRTFTDHEGGATVTHPTVAPTHVPLRDSVQGFGRPVPVGAEAAVSRIEQLASEPGALRRVWSQSFGSRGEGRVANRLRERIASGDRSWLPETRFVPRSQLNGGEAAYSQASGTVFLAEDLLGRRDALLRAYTEELGHHIDHLLGPGDAGGDEGEIFARLTAGEKIAPGELANLRNETDRGSIYVDGKEIEVEFFLKKAFKKVTSTVKKGVGAITDTVGDAIDTMGRGIDSAVGFARSAVSAIAKPIVETLGRFAPFLAWVPGIGTTLAAVYFGAQTALALAGGKASAFLGTLASGALSWAGGRMLAGAQLGSWTRELTGSIGRSFGGVAQDIVESTFQVPGAFVSRLVGVGRAVADGNIAGAMKQFAYSALEPIGRAAGFGVNLGARSLRGTADFLGKLVGAQPASRLLTAIEHQRYGSFFGDTVDLSNVRVQQDPVGGFFGMRAHVVGNTVYLPPENGVSVFDPSGNLSRAGWHTLDHEMGHVLQNQTIGGRYLYEALWAQAQAALGFADGNSIRSSQAAYDWRAGIRSGVPLAGLNPESHAEVIRDMIQQGAPLSSIADFVREHEVEGAGLG